MANKIIFNITNESYNFLLLENNEIAEYHKEKREQSYAIGDICVGVVKKLMPSLNAAFVEIPNSDKHGFLHYSDMSPGIRSIMAFTDEVLMRNKGQELGDLTLLPRTSKDGKIADILTEKQKVLIQVSKEAISNKGPRLSTSLSLAGRYLILIPFSNEITISKKITSLKERSRLNRLMKSIKPNNFGVIVRTVAEGKAVALLDQDLQKQHTRWEEGIEALSNGQRKIINELNPILSILRDVFNETFDQIVVDNKEIYNEIKAYIEEIFPSKKEAVYLYEGSQNIYDYLGLNKKIASLMGTVVGLKGGGYLIVEQTEAMHVIDVNTGNRAKPKANQEDINLEVNLSAAKEVARQLKLRDMGGIIAVDFIGLRDSDNKRSLYKFMKEELGKDRAKSEAIPLTRFGVMEITRARVKPAIIIENQECCSTCQGSGKVQPSIEIATQLEEQLKLLIDQYKLRDITLIVHPYLYAYLHIGLISRKWKWVWRYWQWLNILQDDTIAVTDYKILNKKKEVIATNPKIHKYKKFASERNNITIRGV